MTFCAIIAAARAGAIVQAPLAYASHGAPLAYASHAAPLAYAAPAYAKVAAPLAYAAPVGLYQINLYKYRKYWVASIKNLIRKCSNLIELY